MSLRHNFPRAVSAATLRETKRNRSRLFASLNVMNSKLMGKRVVSAGSVRCEEIRKIHNYVMWRRRTKSDSSVDVATFE